MSFSLSKFIKDITKPGWREKEEAQKLAQQQMNQEDLEKQLMINEATKANELNRSWANQYLSSLKGLPELSYNQGLSQLQRGLQGANDDVYRLMANRGVTGGVDLKALLNNQSAMSKGISQLQGQRLGNIANTQANAYSTMSGLNQGVLANLMNAYQGNDTARTNYINQLNKIAGEKASGGSPLANLIGTAIGGYINPIGTVGGFTGSTLGNNAMALKPDTSYLNNMNFQLGGNYGWRNN